MTSRWNECTIKSRQIMYAYAIYTPIHTNVYATYMKPTTTNQPKRDTKTTLGYIANPTSHPLYADITTTTTKKMSQETVEAFTAQLQGSYPLNFSLPLDSPRVSSEHRGTSFSTLRALFD